MISEFKSIGTGLAGSCVQKIWVKTMKELSSGCVPAGPLSHHWWLWANYWSLTTCTILIPSSFKMPIWCTSTREALQSPSNQIEAPGLRAEHSKRRGKILSSARLSTVLVYPIVSASTPQIWRSPCAPLVRGDFESESFGFSFHHVLHVEGWPWWEVLEEGSRILSFEL